MGGNWRCKIRFHQGIIKLQQSVKASEKNKQNGADSSEPKYHHENLLLAGFLHLACFDLCLFILLSGLAPASTEGTDAA